MPPMGRSRKRAGRRTIRDWKQAETLLERWRKNLVSVRVKLKRPRAIDVVPIDFIRGEPTERQGIQRQSFKGQLIYFTQADITVRRPSGAILVIDNYEIVFVTDGRTRFEPA